MASREPARPSRNRPRRRQSDNDARRSHHKSRKTRRPDAAPTSDESREGKKSRGSSQQTLSSGALAQLDRENERRKHRVEKEGRKRYRGEYERMEVLPRETPQKSKRPAHNSKKRRIVSGAVMEEGRAGRSGLRGGGSWGADSYEKEEQYRLHRHKKPKRRKKLCESSL